MSYPRIIAMDTESVGIGPGGKKSGVAQVSLVYKAGGQIYNQYIKRKGVTDYRTRFSGITKNIMNRRGRKFEDVKQEVLEFLADPDDCILVGHSIHHDLRGLGIPLSQYNIRDTSTYWRFKNANNGKTPGLEFLARRFLNKRIRRNGRHNCVEDAKIALELYELVAHEWEAQIQRSETESEYDDSEYDESTSEYDESESDYYDTDSDPGFDDYGPFAHNNDFF